MTNMNTSVSETEWRERIERTLSDPHLHAERPYGGSPLEDFAEKLSVAADDHADAAMVQAAIESILEAGDRSGAFYDDLATLMALSGFTAPTRAGMLTRLERLLDGIPPAEASRRAAVVAIMLDNHCPINPRVLGKIDDLKTAHPARWLDAAASVETRDAMFRLFRTTIPEMLTDRVLTGADISTRLSYWTDTLVDFRAIILAAVPEYLNLPIDDKHKRPIRGWLERHGYMERRDESSEKSLGLEKLFGGDFLADRRIQPILNSAA